MTAMPQTLASPTELRSPGEDLLCGNPVAAGVTGPEELKASPFHSPPPPRRKQQLLPTRHCTQTLWSLKTPLDIHLHCKVIQLSSGCNLDCTGAHSQAGVSQMEKMQDHDAEVSVTNLKFPADCHPMSHVHRNIVSYGRSFTNPKTQTHTPAARTLTKVKGMQRRHKACKGNNSLEMISS
ncbi:hypothetical protein HispidOSU_004987 [Sigmodon hispidus]